MNMTLLNERRKYPRVALGGVVDMILGEMVRKGNLLDVSPSGIRLECSAQLVNRLNALKTDAGLFPQVQAEFCLPAVERTELPAIGESGSRRKLSLACQVTNCRRLNQDGYELGLSFITVTQADEQSLERYIEGAAGNY